MRDKATRALFEGRPAARFRSIDVVATRKLDMLDAAASLSDPALAARRSPRSSEGRPLRAAHSIRINDRWQLCFVWKDGAEDVEIVDYHR